MKGFGVGLLFAGAAMVVWAFLMNVSVSGSDYGDLPRQIANNDLMNQRLMLAVVGSGAFVSGWLVLILSRLSPEDRKAADAKLFADQV